MPEVAAAIVRDGKQWGNRLIAIGDHKGILSKRVTERGAAYKPEPRAPFVSQWAEPSSQEHLRQQTTRTRALPHAISVVPICKDSGDLDIVHYRASILLCGL